MYLITQLSQYCSMAVKFGEHSTLSLQNSDMGCRIYLLTKFIVSKKLNENQEA
jgi:hypothetical protein